MPPAGRDRPTRSRDARTRTHRLSRDEIVDAGIALADRAGIRGLSMRKLAADLDVDPMSLYHHVRDKDTLLVAMVDAVVARIDPAPGALEPRWTTGLRAQIMAARAVMAQHPWAARILADQTDASPAVLAHIDRVMGILRRGGISVELCHHAIHLFGSRLLGFSQDLFDDSDSSGDPPAPEVLAQWAQTLPNVAALAIAAGHDGPLGGCDDDAEFAFAIDLLLEGMERRRVAEASR